ncbi:hypothetical protein BB561_001985 [Smittium simulii]|uniref:Holocytochrome c-type synthase n=1 Tax=Smittium simulii TaxID=133385 RepID=A0A2T9YS53_9FUNG|nr:hypothetical protein BB561_001985 [Smittium simulii]
MSSLRSYSTIPRAERFGSEGDSQCPAIKDIVSTSNENIDNTAECAEKINTKIEATSSCPVNHDQNSKQDNNTNTPNVWIYPSEQMFFNAMKRKNHNFKENEIKTIVPIHNAVNEMCWKKILEWESMHKSECGMPKLLKFEGKAKDTTIKAWFRTLVGFKPPFDRHDWTVDRCGKHVKYIIDFYGGSSKDAPSFYLDVRPAMTSEGVVDRLKRWWSPDLAQTYSKDPITAGIYPKRD